MYYIQLSSLSLATFAKVHFSQTVSFHALYLQQCIISSIHIAILKIKNLKSKHLSKFVLYGNTFPRNNRKINSTFNIC